MNKNSTGIWTPQEERTLKSNASEDIKTIESLINRSRKSIRDKAYRMGVKLTGKGGDIGRKVDNDARLSAIKMLNEGNAVSYVSQQTGLSAGYCYKLKNELASEHKPSMSSKACNALLNSVFQLQEN